MSNDVEGKGHLESQSGELECGTVTRRGRSVFRSVGGLKCGIRVNINTVHSGSQYVHSVSDQSSLRPPSEGETGNLSLQRVRVEHSPLLSRLSDRTKMQSC